MEFNLQTAAPENVQHKWCFLNSKLMRKNLDKRGYWELRPSLGKEVRNCTMAVRLFDPPTNSNSGSFYKNTEAHSEIFREMLSTSISWIQSVSAGRYIPQVKDKFTTIWKPGSNIARVQITVNCGMENASIGENQKGQFPSGFLLKPHPQFPQEWWLLMKLCNENMIGTASRDRMCVPWLQLHKKNRHHDKRPGRWMNKQTVLAVSFTRWD